MDLQVKSCWYFISVKIKDRSQARTPRQDSPKLKLYYRNFLLVSFKWKNKVNIDSCDRRDGLISAQHYCPWLPEYPQKTNVYQKNKFWAVTSEYKLKVICQIPRVVKLDESIVLLCIIMLGQGYFIEENLSTFFSIIYQRNLRLASI
jgi:hypothetical protein